MVNNEEVEAFYLRRSGYVKYMYGMFDDCKSLKELPAWYKNNNSL